MYEAVSARSRITGADALIKKLFGEIIGEGLRLDAIYLDSGFKSAAGAAGIPAAGPFMLELMKEPAWVDFLPGATENGASLLILCREDISIYVCRERIERLEAPERVISTVKSSLAGMARWAGSLNESGDHITDLRTPSPGPHFNVNLLLGNRTCCAHPLQTTPKSVVDRLGRGSFRSHAATQVLATRWDMRQEENGFPANRQFYLVEDGKKIFYSAEPLGDYIEKAYCRHSQNHTVITYRTKCGLEIERLIFILPQYDGLPLATEVQQITVKNHTDKPRRLKLAYTGMFGTASPHALQEDVLYSNIILQARLLRNPDGSIAAIAPEYYPEYAGEDIRFHTMLVRGKGGLSFPTEFCSDYNCFVGGGTLENPEFLLKPDCRLNRKGPGFFALFAQFETEPGGSCVIDNFTGAVSAKGNPDFGKDTYKEEIEKLIDKFSAADEVAKALEEQKRFYSDYRSYLEVHTSDSSFDSYVNLNLPFQVLYQTFVSRSFCQTQKGYREIGFREIQDLFASMYYFNAMGRADLVRDLLTEWCSNIFEFGYAYHNFFWKGKEPGKWSDDALWFIQAASRYIKLTGDMALLDLKCAVAGEDREKARTVYDTIKAVIRYSGEISVGRHGLPLLDNADWNDCLKLDKDYLEGAKKEELYCEQIANGGIYGEPLKNDCSESVMNAFLLKKAMDDISELAEKKGDVTYLWYLSDILGNLEENLRKCSWKGDFYARVLFNRYKDGRFAYLGAGGDGLSADPRIDGSYFLNSFSWSVLSGVADEKQIEIMLDIVEKYLKTPYGLKLVTPTDLGKIADDTATGHYFPGDRENGAVFKHAAMMATAAMFKASCEVSDAALAARLANLAYWMVDRALPYKTMEEPFATCGNPRFCTQYINSETGENIGPLLSGTATWLILALQSALGVEHTFGGIKLDPVLREEENCLSFKVKCGNGSYTVEVEKPTGFRRLADGNAEVTLDGTPLGSRPVILPNITDSSQKRVKIIFTGS